MKDSMGRGFWERRREAAFEKSHQSDNERREELKKAFDSKSGKGRSGSGTSSRNLKVM